MITLIFADSHLKIAPEKAIHQEGYREWTFSGGGKEILQMVLTQGDKATFLTANNMQKQILITDIHVKEQDELQNFSRSLAQIRKPFPMKEGEENRQITISNLAENPFQPPLVSKVVKKDGFPNGVARYSFSDETYFTEYYQLGTIEGAKIFFYPSGKVHNILYFREGAVYGKEIVFYESGVIQRIVLRKDGVKIKRIGFYKTGEISEITPIVNGQYHGESISYLRDGSPFGRTLWANGKVVREQVLKEITARQAAESNETNLPPLKALWVEYVKHKNYVSATPKTEGKARLATDSKERNWTSRSGKIIKGVLISADDQSARFKVQGRMFNIAIAKLKDSDQELIKKLTSK